MSPPRLWTLAAPETSPVGPMIVSPRPYSCEEPESPSAITTASRGPLAVPSARWTAPEIALKLSAYCERGPGSGTAWMSTYCGPQLVPMSNRSALVPPSWAERKRSTIATLAWIASFQPRKRSGRSAA